MSSSARLAVTLASYGVAIILVFVVLGGVFFSPDRLSIIGDSNTRAYSFDGVELLVNADWQQTVLGNENDCVFLVEDVSDSSQVGASYITSGSDIEDFCRAKVYTTEFAIPSVDLRFVDRMQVFHEIDFSVRAEHSKSVVSSSVMGSSSPVSNKPVSGSDTFSGSVDGVIDITSSDGVIVVKSFQGEQVFPVGASPEIFTMAFSMGVSSGDPNDVDGEVLITGVEVTYQDGVDPSAPVEMPPSGFFSRLWAGIMNFFAWIGGLFA